MRGSPRSEYYEIIRYGRLELLMRDADMARELCISRERVRQIRFNQGIPKIDKGRGRTWRKENPEAYKEYMRNRRQKKKENPVKESK